MALGFSSDVVETVLGRDGSARAPLESLVEQCLNFKPDREPVRKAAAAAPSSSPPPPIPTPDQQQQHPGPASTDTRGAPKTTKQWRCEFCEFVDPSFDACCAHEEVCAENPDVKAVTASTKAAARNDFMAAKTAAAAPRGAPPAPAPLQKSQASRSGSGSADSGSAGAETLMQAWRCEFCDHVDTSFDAVTKHEAGCSKGHGGGGGGTARAESSGSEYETDSDEEAMIANLDAVESADMLLLGLADDAVDVIPKCPDGQWKITPLPTTRMCPRMLMRRFQISKTAPCSFYTDMSLPK